LASWLLGFLVPWLLGSLEKRTIVGIRRVFYRTLPLRERLVPD
jgi:hypothetical protein